MAKPAVFISSSVEGLGVARELGRQLEKTATVTLWAESAFHPGQTVFESLAEVVDRSDFAVFVLTAAPSSTSGESRWTPRPNVLFELGFFAGRLGLARTFVVADPGRAALPSDLAGTMSIALPMNTISDVATAVSPAVAAIQRAISNVQTPKEREEDYYSCFISYAWKDKEFAVRLHNDLQEVGVRCWLDAKELKVGDNLAEQIARAIQAHDKVLLVLSEASARSSWVRIEVKNALQLERQRQKTVLFPLRVDDAVLSVSGVPEIDRLKEKVHWRLQ